LDKARGARSIRSASGDDFVHLFPDDSLGIVRIVHDYAIYPRIIGHGMPLHPFAVIAAVLCGAALAGVPGIFLAIPSVAILSVAYRHWVEHTGSQGLVADLLNPRK
jgi:predicted PurR-regulated permease PerM